jgi:hypothetical protein
MDTSRMSAGQIQMYYNKQRHQEAKDQKKNSQDELRQRQQTQNGTGHRALHDLIKSDFYKTVNTTLQNNRKKEHIQRNLNDTIDNLSNDTFDDFAKKF